MVVLRVPARGDYLAYRSPPRLVMVLGLNERGEYEVQDVVTETLDTIAPHELSQWEPAGTSTVIE